MSIKLSTYLLVVYGDSSTRICGGSMWIDPPRMTGSHVTESHVSHVTGSDMTGSGPVRQYVLRMRNRKLRNIRLHRK